MDWKVQEFCKIWWDGFPMVVLEACGGSLGNPCLPPSRILSTLAPVLLAQPGHKTEQNNLRTSGNKGPQKKAKKDAQAWMPSSLSKLGPGAQISKGQLSALKKLGPCTPTIPCHVEKLSPVEQGDV